MVKKTNRRRRKENAKKPITITITPSHVRKAKCGDPAACVVAQALLDTFGDLFEGCEIGARVIRIITETKVVRYSTPHKLTKAIPVFDDTKRWNLPPGEYTLMPYKSRPRRWEKAKRRGGTQSTFIGRKVPSRRLTHINKLCEAA